MFFLFNCLIVHDFIHNVQTFSFQALLRLKLPVSANSYDHRHFNLFQIPVGSTLRNFNLSQIPVGSTLRYFNFFLNPGG